MMCLGRTKWSSKPCLVVLSYLTLAIGGLEAATRYREWSCARVEVLRLRQELHDTEGQVTQHMPSRKQAVFGAPYQDAHLSLSDVVERVIQVSRRIGNPELSYESKDGTQYTTLEESHLTFKVQGPWQGLLSFLETLESPPLRLRVRSVFVTKSYEQNGVAMEVATAFVRRRAGGNRPPEQPISTPKRAL